MISIIFYGSMTFKSSHRAQISLWCCRLVFTQWKYYLDIPFWLLKIKSSSEPPSCSPSMFLSWWMALQSTQLLKAETLDFSLLWLSLPKIHQHLVNKHLPFPFLWFRPPRSLLWIITRIYLVSLQTTNTTVKNGLSEIQIWSSHSLTENFTKGQIP